MTFAPATIAPMEYLRAKPKLKSIYKQNPYPQAELQRHNVGLLIFLLFPVLRYIHVHPA